MAGKHTSEKALSLLRYLPRVALTNIRDNPGSKSVSKLRSGCVHGLLNCCFSARSVGEDSTGVINMVQVIKVLDRDKTTCDWGMKLAIIHFI